MKHIDLLWDLSILEVELKIVEKGIKDYYIFDHDVNIGILKRNRYNLKENIDKINQEIKQETILCQYRDMLYQE